jgi:hypothetical protein
LDNTVLVLLSILTITIGCIYQEGLGDRSPFEEAAALIRLANWNFIGLLINADAVWATDPYGGAKFYFGDTHFHAGYSGDNRDDRPPIAAFLTALGNSKM